MRFELPPPQVIVLFGASGNLAMGKILPALWDLAAERLLPDHYAIVGYALNDWNDEAFRAAARESAEGYARNPVTEAGWHDFARGLSFVSGSSAEPEGMASLGRCLTEIDDRLGTDGRRMYYLATPPSAFTAVVDGLRSIDRNGRARVVVEKPFGSDLASASELNRILRKAFTEQQIFRIDHYLGKETVQNIFVFRFANAMFERIWNRDAIDHVQITVAESVGVEGRGRYYEEAGAVRDMIQNHVLQVLAFLAMEPPRAMDSEAIRDEKVKVLRSLRPVDSREVVRGQYRAGTVDGQTVRGYRSEPEVAADSDTETFVAIRAWIDNWRWEGVPFFLRTGKRLPHRATEIALILREPPAYLFEDVGHPSPAGDHIVLYLHPDQGITIMFHAKVPGPGISLQRVDMTFSYGQSFKTRPVEAYERLLHDVMLGDHTLFPREDEVMRAWDIVSPVLHNPPRLTHYAAGTPGPAEADSLIAPSSWHLR